MEIKDISHKRGGLVTHLRKIDVKPGLPQISRYLSVIKNFNGEVITGSGFSLTTSNAKKSAIGEAVERYCSQIVGNDIVEANFTELENALDPLKITKPTDEQYRVQPHLRNVNHITKLEWVKGVNIFNGQNVWIPKELVYLTKNKYRPLRDIISTGLACGKNRKQSQIKALLECIERDAFVLFWMLGIVNFEIDSKCVDNSTISELISLGNHSGLEIKLYDITQEFGAPTVLALIRRKGTKGFYFGCASSLNYESAIISSLEEGLGGYSVFWEYIHFHELEVPKHIDQITTLDDHALYYLDGNRDGILEDLFTSNLSVKNINSLLKEKSLKYEDLLSSLEKFGHIPYVIDLTTPDSAQVNLFVSRVVIPSLAFLPIGEPFLNCPRLYKKKQNLNRNFNLIPHPFP